LPLFPQRADELVIKCSCPDWSNPCKHVAAVYYLLAEEFDRDPFLLFHLRGIEREEMAQLIDAAPIAGAAKASVADDTAETLPTDIASFWQGTAITGSSTGGVTPPTSPAPVAKRLGGFPFWRGDEDFLDALAQAYQVATARGMEIYLSTLVP
jgi:uncharacterized Zn finger protein